MKSRVTTLLASLLTMTFVVTACGKRANGDSIMGDDD